MAGAMVRAPQHLSKNDVYAQLMASRKSQHRKRQAAGESKRQLMGAGVALGTGAAVGYAIAGNPSMETIGDTPVPTTLAGGLVAGFAAMKTSGDAAHYLHVASNVMLGLAGADFGAKQRQSG